MAETIDEARIIAWIDGELDPAAAAEVEAALEQNDELAALAERHRHLKARFAAAFAPIAEPPAEKRAPAPIVSLAAVRAERRAEDRARSASRRWVLPGAIAASLLLGVLVGHEALAPIGIGDRPGALALDRRVAAALDGQLSGEAGPVRIALTFRNKQGLYCRSFAGVSLSGIACRAGSGWALRYGAPGQAPTAGYRQAGADEAAMAAIETMIAGDPLDRAAEAHARNNGWR